MKSNPAPSSSPGGSSPLAFATNNAGKLREAQQWLGVPVEGIGLHLEELQTTGLEDLVLHKTRQAFALTERPVMIEDTALVFTAWGALPGPFVKYFLADLGTAGMVRALEPFQDFRALAISSIGYHDGKSVHLFEGRTEGMIVPPRGDHGFGWDAIFQPRGASVTYGEMAPEIKRLHSMRALAFQALAGHLKG